MATRTLSSALLAVAISWSVAAGRLAADPASEAPSAGPPSELHLEVSVGTGAETDFVRGERIPLELAFSATVPDRWELDAATYDRSGRMHLEGFEVEPADGVVDPLEDVFAAGGGPLGGLRSMPTLSSEAEVVHLTLNEWVRFDRAGSYRLVVTTRRVRDLRLDRSDPAAIVPLVSNPVEIVIRDPDPAWEAEQLTEIDRSLGTPIETTIRDGCERLRHLGTPGALDRLAVLLARGDGRCGPDLFAGLDAFPDPRAVVRRLEREIDGPGAVGPDLVSFLARARWRRERSEAGGEGASSAVWRERIEHWKRLDLERLAAALPRKEGAARAATLSTLLEAGTSLPALEGDVPDLLAEIFRDLDGDTQIRWLDGSSWERIRGPALVPVLRELADDPPEGTTLLSLERPRDLVVRRLRELDPAAARSVILREMSRPDPGLGTAVLGLLEDATLPPAVEAAVVRHLFTADPWNGWEEVAFVLGRYGSPRARPAVERFVAGGGLDRARVCWRAPILAYLLRTDPMDGERLLREAVARPRPEEVGGCRRDLLADVAEILPGAEGMSEVESAAIALLEGGDAEARTGATTFLRERGGPTAEEPLWRRLERWSEEGGDSRDPGFGWELVRALFQASGWALDGAGLERLAGLAEGQARMQVEMRRAFYAGGTDVPLVLHSTEPFFADVGGHHEDSEEALERRMGQFPRGTVFRLRGGAADPAAQAPLESLEEHLAGRGMGLVVGP